MASTTHQTRQIRFEYHLLDKNGNHKMQLYNVLSASVRYASLGQLKGSANITMTEHPLIDYINDLIEIKCIIDNRSYPLGQYVISSPKRRIEGSRVIRECQCYSKLIYLQDDKMEDRHVCNIGTNVINEVKRLIAPYPYEIEDSALTLQTAREWEIGTSKLDIINDLLAAINWTSLIVQNDGEFSAAPYVLPSDRAIEFEFESDENSIIYPDKEDDLDLFAVPNVVILKTNSADVDPPMAASYTNNSVDSPTSVPSRGRRIAHFEEVNNIVTQEILNQQAKKRLYELSDVYNTVTWSTAIHPESFGYMNCIYIKTPKIEGKYIQTSCEIDCRAGGQMQRSMRKAYNI